MSPLVSALVSALVSLFVSAIVIPAIAVAYAGRRGTEAAEMGPKDPISRDKRVVVCLGDSLTHGRVGHDWVADLRVRNPDWHVVNAGTNGEVTWQIVQRVDEVLALEPEAVVVLIGCNDCMATLSEKDGKAYKKNNDLPQIPDIDWYRSNLEGLLARLEGVPTAVMTMVPLGEDGIDHVGPYNAIIEELAPTVLPLHQELAKQRRPGPGHRVWMDRKVIVLSAIVKHYVLGRSWDRIAEERGGWLLVDGIHVSDRGGAIIADLVEDYFRGVLRSS